MVGGIDARRPLEHGRAAVQRDGVAVRGPHRVAERESHHAWGACQDRAVPRERADEVSMGLRRLRRGCEREKSGSQSQSRTAHAAESTESGRASRRGAFYVPQTGGPVTRMLRRTDLRASEEKVYTPCLSVRGHRTVPLKATPVALLTPGPRSRKLSVFERSFTVTR